MDRLGRVLLVAVAALLAADLAIGAATLARAKTDSVAVPALVAAYTAVTDRRAVEIAVLNSRLQEAVQEIERLRGELKAKGSGK